MRPGEVCTFLRLHKLATIHVASVVWFLGVLEAASRAEVAAKLKRLLALD